MWDLNCLTNDVMLREIAKSTEEEYNRKQAMKRNLYLKQQQHFTILPLILAEYHSYAVTRAWNR